MPDSLADGAFLAIGGRAAVGTRVQFILQDLTETLRVEAAFVEWRDRDILSFTGADNAFAKSSKTTIPAIAGHVYRLTPAVSEWSHANVSGTTANGIAVGYGIGSEDHFLYGSVVGAWVFSDHYDIRVPEGVTGAHVLVGGRADAGVEVVFKVEDITPTRVLTEETFAPFAEKSGTLSSGDNYDYVECNLLAGEEYLMCRRFERGILNLNATAAGNSGMKVWLSNSATANDQASTIQTIEQVYYQTGAFYFEVIRFTAEANARYLRLFVKAKSADSGQGYAFGVGKDNGQSVYELGNKVTSLLQDVQVGKAGTIPTQGVAVNSITTSEVQKLYLGDVDAAFLKGKRVLIVDDVISTGESLAALEELMEKIGVNVVGKACVLAEGDAKNRDDIIFLEELPLFKK